VAATPEGARLTEQHRLEQQQVTNSFLVEFIALWALLDTDRLDETSPGWVRAVLRAIQDYRNRSARVAVAYYGAFAEQERPGGAPELVIPRLWAPTEQVREPIPMPTRARNRLEPVVPRRDTRTASQRTNHTDTGRGRVRVTFDDSGLDRGRSGRSRVEMSDLSFEREDRAVKVSLEVTGPVAQKSKTSRNKPRVTVRDESFEAAAGAATRHVLTGGRRSLLTLVEADPKALAWARVTDGAPCAFCAMLASRGPVYGSEAAAGFSAHDACACTAEPVYSRQAPWPGRAREFQELWRETTRNTSGRDSINAFRRAYEQQQRDQRRRGVA
jgi:hypothetical protein